MSRDYEIRAFTDSKVWRTWLADNHNIADGLWVRLYKKASGVASVTYAEALDDALCFGWIDGQKKSYDEQSFIQKFTPRRSKSMWSKRNIEHVARLTEQGLMMPSGQAEIERAQADGRWQAAYDKPSEMVVPQSFLDELSKNPVAEKFYATLNKSNTYAIAWRLQTAKTDETRQRRQSKIIDMLNAEQKLH
jgi:uncharacterized protein YdeI (YjbR/CyaY-like superfamily)